MHLLAKIILLTVIVFLPVILCVYERICYMQDTFCVFVFHVLFFSYCHVDKLYIYTPTRSSILLYVPYEWKFWRHSSPSDFYVLFFPQPLVFPPHSQFHAWASVCPFSCPRINERVNIKLQLAIMRSAYIVAV